MKSKLPHGLCWHGWGWGDSFLFRKLVIFQKFSLLLSCPFPGPFTQGSRLLLDLFLSVPVDISRLLAIPAFILDYVQWNENPENSSPCHRSLDPEVPSCFAFSSPIRIFMFVLCIMPKVFSCIWKSISTPASWKWKSSGYIFAVWIFCRKHESFIQISKYRHRCIPCFFRTDNCLISMKKKNRI